MTSQALNDIRRMIAQCEPIPAGYVEALVNEIERLSALRRAEVEQLYRELAQARVLMRRAYDDDDQVNVHPEASEGTLIEQHHFVYAPAQLGETRGLYDRPTKGTASPHRCTSCGKVVELPYATAYTEFGEMLKHVAFDEPCPPQQAKLDAAIADEIAVLRARITNRDLDKQRSVADHQHERQ